MKNSNITKFMYTLGCPKAPPPPSHDIILLSTSLTGCSAIKSIAKFLFTCKKENKQKKKLLSGKVNQTENNCCLLFPQVVPLQPSREAPKCFLPPCPQLQQFRLCCKIDQQIEDIKCSKNHPLSLTQCSGLQHDLARFSKEVSRNKQAAENRKYLTDAASVLYFCHQMIKLQKDSALINSKITVGQVRLGEKTANSLEPPIIQVIAPVHMKLKKNPLPWCLTIRKANCSKSETKKTI